MDLFQNNKAIAEFMEVQQGVYEGDHKDNFVIELEQGAYFGGQIASSSRKIEMNNVKINMRSPRENHKMALSDHEKGK